MGAVVVLPAGQDLLVFWQSFTVAKLYVKHICMHTHTQYTVM